MWQFLNKVIYSWPWIDKCELTFEFEGFVRNALEFQGNYEIVHILHTITVTLVVTSFSMNF
jgi:hypothetical protein